MKNKKNTQDKILLIISVIIILSIISISLFLDYIIPSPEIDTEKINELTQITQTESLTKTHQTNPNASITIIEFSDFQCPICKEAHTNTNKILAEYGDKINYIFKHFPVKSGSKMAAVATECAREQNMFFEYANYLYRKDKLNTIAYLDIATDLNLDINKFQKCLNNPDKITNVEIDFTQGVELGVRGTPTYIINGKKIEGSISYERFKTMIEALI